MRAYPPPSVTPEGVVEQQLNPTIAISAGERSFSGRTSRRRTRRRQPIGRGCGLLIAVGKAVQAVDWRNPTRTQRRMDGTKSILLWIVSGLRFYFRA